MPNVTLYLSPFDFRLYQERRKAGISASQLFRRVLRDAPKEQQKEPTKRERLEQAIRLIESTL